MKIIILAIRFKWQCMLNVGQTPQSVVTVITKCNNEAHKYYPSILVHQYDVNVFLANTENFSGEDISTYKEEAHKY